MYNAEIGLEYQTSTVNEISKDFGGSDFDFAIQQEDRNKLWTARYDFHFYKYTHSPMHPGASAIITRGLFTFNHFLKL
jgi:D-lactate dehydrogenase (cytochrome)